MGDEAPISIKGHHPETSLTNFNNHGKKRKWGIPQEFLFALKVIIDSKGRLESQWQLISPRDVVTKLGEPFQIKVSLSLKSKADQKMKFSPMLIYKNEKQPQEKEKETH